MVLPHHAGKCLPKTKGFFPHDFTLIASVMGESVIGHDIGGNISQLKWCDLLKASRWSKRWGSVLVTQSHSQSTSDGSEDPLTLTSRIIGDSLCRISTTSLIEVAYELLVSYKLIDPKWELVWGPPAVSHARRLSYEHSHSRLSRYQTLPDCVESYAMRTGLSSFFKSSLV